MAKCSCGREFTPVKPNAKTKDVQPEEIYCPKCLSSGSEDDNLFDREYENSMYTISIWDKVRNGG